jgi:hypothetical protein
VSFLGLVPGDYPPTPPKNAPSVIAPFFKCVEVDSAEELDAKARELGVAANDEWNPQLICECVSPKARVMLMLSKAATGDDALWEARYLHGVAHTWGYVHPAGEPRKWLAPDGKPVD